jgi:hypothetical protein
MKTFKKFTIIHFTLLFLSLSYCFEFYFSICLEIAIMALIFDLVKPTIFISMLNSKGIYKGIYGAILTILIMFNLLAISSGFINNYNKQSSTKVINQGYAIHQDKIKQFKTNLDNVQSELNQYPTLEIFLSKSPKWEDKEGITKNWQDGKQEISKRLDIAQTAYNNELSNKINKYNIESKKMGYSSIFKTISSKTKTSNDTLIFILYMLAAIVFETLIFYTKVLSKKESQDYIKSNDELTKELINEMNLEIHRKQLEAIKYSFNNNIMNNIKPMINEQINENVRIEIEEPKELIENLDLKENDIEVDPLDEDLEVEKVNYKFTGKPLAIENIRAYHNFILENSKDDIAVGYKKVAENLGLRESEAQRIYNKLKEKNYLKSSDRKTLIEKKNFDESDFIKE